MTPTNNTTPVEEWENGTLTFDSIATIMEVCNVKIVEIRPDSLHISFVPKSVTGKVWRELKEKMLQTTGKWSVSHRCTGG